MVGSIYYILMPYSHFRQAKGRPVLAVHELDKNDILVMPLTSNLTRRGFKITQKDIASGALRKDSVIIVPKLTAVDRDLLGASRHIATLKEATFIAIKHTMCSELQCIPPSKTDS